MTTDTNRALGSGSKLWTLDHNPYVLAPAPSPWPLAPRPQTPGPSSWAKRLCLDGCFDGHCAAGAGFHEFHGTFFRVSFSAAHIMS